MIYHDAICKNNFLENKLLLISINCLEKMVRSYVFLGL